MIYTAQFYDVDKYNGINDTIDALWCQSANNGTNIGVWYYPNGTEVPVDPVKLHQLLVQCSVRDSAVRLH